MTVTPSAPALVEKARNRRQWSASPPQPPYPYKQLREAIIAGESRTRISTRAHVGRTALGEILAGLHPIISLSLLRLLEYLELEIVIRFRPKQSKWKQREQSPILARWVKERQDNQGFIACVKYLNEDGQLRTAVRRCISAEEASEVCEQLEHDVLCYGSVQTSPKPGGRPRKTDEKTFT